MPGRWPVMRLRRPGREAIEAAPFYAIGLLACVGLKRFYSAASADDLGDLPQWRALGLQLGAEAGDLGPAAPPG